MMAEKKNPQKPDDYVELPVEQQDELPESYYQQPMPNMPTAPKRNLIQGALDKLTGQPDMSQIQPQYPNPPYPNPQYPQPRQPIRQPPIRYPPQQPQQNFPPQKQQSPYITKVQAAIEVIREVSQIKQITLVGVIGMLLATGIGALLSGLGMFGYVIPIAFLVYFMWKYMSSDKKLKYLKYNYGL
jgi:hypothetical protein